jgi:hypothetical protein
LSNRIRQSRPSPALLISCLALFVSLTGSAFAAGVLGKNSVHSSQIANGSVRAIDLQRGAVRATKIAAGAVGADQLAPAAVGPGQLAPAAVGTGQLAEGAVQARQVGPHALTAGTLAPGAVGSPELRDHSIEEGDLAPESVGNAQLQQGSVTGAQLEGNFAPFSVGRTLNPGESKTVTVECPNRGVAISAGLRSSPAGVRPLESAQPDLAGPGRSWTIGAKNESAAMMNVGYIVYCLF